MQARHDFYAAATTWPGQKATFALSLTRWLGILALSIWLAACGGSGDNDAAAVESPPEVEEPGTPSEPEAPQEPEIIDISAQCPIHESDWLIMDTDLDAPIDSKDDYIGAQLRWRHTRDGIDLLTLWDARTRGRGNSTWWLMPKKSYKLKLDKKTALYDMAPGKDWAILANYADKTMLRNALAFCMARTLELPYTPGSQFLELVLNGQYDGVYQLTNKVYEVTDQVKADAKLAHTDAGSSHFNDVFLLEMFYEAELTGRTWFGTESGINLQFRSDVADEQQISRIQTWMNELEALIADRRDPQRLQKVAERMNLQSLVDVHLVNELMTNQDGFRYSTYLYRLNEGRLTFGPVWDFDQSLGLSGFLDDGQGWGTRPRQEMAQGWYFWELLSEPDFFDLVQQRWQLMYALLPSYSQFLHDSGTALSAAADRNFKRWPILGELVFTNHVAFDTYEKEVDYARQWLTLRAEWIQNHISQISAP